MLSQPSMATRPTAATLPRAITFVPGGKDRNAIVDQAIKRLRASQHPPVRALSCEYHEGMLILRGQVASFYHKQLAQEAIRNLSGVDEVVNAVEVVW